MVITRSYVCWTFLFYTLYISNSQGRDVNSQLCSPSVSFKQNYCHHLQVPAPLPFECGGTPADCFPAKNLITSMKHTKVFLDYNRVFQNQVNDECLNHSTTQVLSGHWHVKLERMQSIYVILIRSLGNQQSTLSVNISRQISNNLQESITCTDLSSVNGYNSFYCFPPDGALASNHRPGFDAHFVNIFGDIYIDSCDFSSILRLYSYPINVCGTPEFRVNQTISPKIPYYLVGQEVTYSCSNETILVGSAGRICQINGLWSGGTPICVRIQRLQPNTQSTIPHLEVPKWYFAASTLARATSLDENQAITYSFDQEYCINSILIEFHSELSLRTRLTVYTTSVDGSHHLWRNNGSFGNYRQKQFYFPQDYQQFVCCLNVTLKRQKDMPLYGTFKRREFVYKVDVEGYLHKNLSCLSPNLPNEKFVIKQRNSVSNGASLQLKCKRGFNVNNGELDGTILTCYNGQWRGKIPTCERTLCPEPLRRQYLTWKYLESGDHSYNTVKYQCEPGYKLIGRDDSSCVNGSWTTPSPDCQITFCPALSVSLNLYCMLRHKNRYRDQQGNSYHHGVGVVCYCLPGFHLVGNPTIDCYDGQWTSELPECQEVYCKNVPFVSQQPDTDAWNMRSGRWRTGSHNFSCAENFVIKSSNKQDHPTVELECLDTGEWEEKEVVECVPLRTSISQGKLAGVITGAILIATLLAWSILFLVKRWKRSYFLNLKSQKSKTNLTTSQEVSFQGVYVAVSEELYGEAGDVTSCSVNPISTN